MGSSRAFNAPPWPAELLLQLPDGAGGAPTDHLGVKVYLNDDVWNMRQATKGQASMGLIDDRMLDMLPDDVGASR